MKRWHWLSIIFVVVIGIAATGTHGPFSIRNADPCLDFWDNTVGDDDWDICAGGDEFTIRQQVGDSTWTDRFVFNSDGDISSANTIAGDWDNTANPWSVDEGGTGVATFTDGGVLLGSGTGAVTAMPVLTDGQMIVGDGTTDPVAESGATLRTSIGVGTTDSLVLTGLQVTTIELGHATDTTITRLDAGDLGIEGQRIHRLGGTDIVDSDIADTLTIDASSTVDPDSLSQAGASTNEVLEWDGSNWSPAADDGAAAFSGALVTLVDADQTFADGSTNEVVVWDTEVYDTDTFSAAADTSTNADRLTVVGADVNYVRLTANIEWHTDNSTSNGHAWFSIRKNGAVFAGMPTWSRTNNNMGDENFGFTLVSPVIPVSQNDYFTVVVKWTDSPGSVTIGVESGASGEGSWFTIEKVVDGA